MSLILVGAQTGGLTSRAVVLDHPGFLAGHRATGHPGFVDYLTGVKLELTRVVVTNGNCPGNRE